MLTFQQLIQQLSAFWGRQGCALLQPYDMEVGAGTFHAATFLRAIETGRMHLAATNTGITAAIDRDGRVLARLPQYAEARLEVQAQGYAGATPYVRLRDWPAILVSLAVLGLFIFRARMTR